MKKPIEPNQEDCCNSGCNPCIFDIYEQKLKIYNNYLKTGETSDSKQFENGIAQLQYTTFVLINKVQICELHMLLVFKKSNEINEDRYKKVWWKPANHFLLKYSNESVSCTRAYTPIKLNNISEDYDFCIIIKVYENGLVSNYLKDLQLKEHTLWRGPYGSYDVNPNRYNRIIMITHGTAIVTFISIIEKILENEDDMTRIILNYCVKNEESILLRDELYSFQDYWNFSYKLFTSESKSGTQIKYQEPIVNHKFSIEDLMTLKPFNSQDQFLISGSKQFMQSFQTVLMEADVSSENIVLF